VVRTPFPSLPLAAIIVAAPASAQLSPRQRAMIDLATMEMRSVLAAESMTLTGTGGMSGLGRTPMVIEGGRLKPTWPYCLSHYKLLPAPEDKRPPLTASLFPPVIKDLDQKANGAAYVIQLARTLGPLAPDGSPLGQGSLLAASELYPYQLHDVAVELHRLYGGELWRWESAVGEALKGVKRVLVEADLNLRPYVARLLNQEAALVPEARPILRQLGRDLGALGTERNEGARLHALVTAVTKVAKLYSAGGAADARSLPAGAGAPPAPRPAGPAAPPAPRPAGAASGPRPAAPPPTAAGAPPAAAPPAPRTAAMGAPDFDKLPLPPGWKNLPRVLKDRIQDFSGELFGAPRRERLPFLDLHHSGRLHRFPTPPGTPAAVTGPGRPQPLPAYVRHHEGPRLAAAYGLPYPLLVPPVPKGGGQLVTLNDTYRDPSVGMIQREFMPGMPTVVRFTGHMDSIFVENLEPDAGASAPGGWRSHLYHTPVKVRGLLPLAGNAAEAGHRDARGREALCGRPVGMDVHLGWDHERLVFTEEGGHAVRRCTTDGGEVSTLCGSAGEAGYRDGPAMEARFRNPTFVTVGRLDDGLPIALVSDPGNHAVRQVNLITGEVSTYYRTENLVPRGLVWTGHELFLADQDSHAILAITPPEGQVVRVLAGGVAPEGGRAVDGTGTAARFLEFQGMAGSDVNFHGRHDLFVLDGHALRMVSPDGLVRTLAGQPEVAGFADTPERDGEPGAPPASFRNPIGVTVAWQTVYVADTGNHALREYDRIFGTVTTLAGDPDAGAVRWGLLRDGLAGPFPGADYAALSAPMAIAFNGRRDGNHEEQHLFLGTGSTLADLPPGFGLPRRGGGLPWVKFSDPVAGTPDSGPVPRAFLVEPSLGAEESRRFGRPAVPPVLPATPFHFHYWVECFAADGTAAGRVLSAAQGRFGTSIPMPPLGLAPGTYTLRIRLVTLDGHTVAATRAVTVPPGP